MENRKYIRKVEAALSCSKDTKKGLIKIVKNDLDAFLLEYPDATEKDLIRKFGAPDELAESYLDSLEISEVNAQLKKTKSIKKIIITSICIVVVILFALFVSILLYCNKKPTYVNEKPGASAEPYVIIRYD